MTDDALTSRANVVLHLDNGAEMQFSGRPFAGGSWFDDETGELTRQIFIPRNLASMFIPS